MFEARSLLPNLAFHFSLPATADLLLLSHLSALTRRGSASRFLFALDSAPLAPVVSSFEFRQRWWERRLATQELWCSNPKPKGLGSLVFVFRSCLVDRRQKAAVTDLRFGRRCLQRRPGTP